MSNYILNGIMGFCVGDALGVPVCYFERAKLRNDPVIDMRAYGSHDQPAGTWSDNVSLTLCLMDSLTEGLDYKETMGNFLKWLDEADYTPHGKTFVERNSIKNAIKRFSDGITPLECGGKSENDNGNGSLMRILPILFYLRS